MGLIPKAMQIERPSFGAAFFLCSSKRFYKMLCSTQTRPYGWVQVDVNAHQFLHESNDFTGIVHNQS